LKFAGAGPQEAELKSFCASTGLSDRVEFLGQVSAMAPLFSGATVVVVPSQYGEAFGIVTAEAMASGSCLLASDDGGTPEVLGPAGEAGLVFKSGDPVDLELKLRQLLSDPDTRQRLRREARVRAERFSLTSMVDAYVSVYDEIAKELSARRPRVVN
jgi:phosphatidylinositol alpha-mannosyltransferase